ncbi:peptidase M48 family protein [Xanthomonas citri pv. punicae str. LMG 859]|nr:peptidase M48 family protein [Xanthomonas citri pv. punicae str. LMG 859]
MRRQAQAAGIGMPEVAVYEGPEINAFATGANRNNALVAVSTGLLQNMDQDEAEAVLGHEIAHVANGDMVTMALLQGVLNTFVIVLARVVGGIIDSALSGNREGGRGFAYYIIVFALEMVFGLFATMIAMWFSRRREFRADAAGRPQQDDRCTGAAVAQPWPEHLALASAGVRHLRRGGRGLAPPVPEPSPAHRTHRCAARGQR